MRRTGTSVVFVDQQEIFRAGLSVILDALPVVVVGFGSSAKDALDLVRSSKPHAILLDAALESAGAGTLVRELVRLSPGTAVILLGADPGPREVLACVAAGASGYLLKSAPRDELAAAIQRSVGGEAFVDPLLAGRLLQALSERAERPAEPRPDPLTAREREVLGEISRGRSNKEIATELSMANGTVKIHVERILRKLSASNRVEAATIGLHHGLIAEETDAERALRVG